MDIPKEVTQSEGNFTQNIYTPLPSPTSLVGNQAGLDSKQAPTPSQVTRGIEPREKRNPAVRFRPSKVKKVERIIVSNLPKHRTKPKPTPISTSASSSASATSYVPSIPSPLSPNFPLPPHSYHSSSTSASTPSCIAANPPETSTLLTKPNQKSRKKSTKQQTLLKSSTLALQTAYPTFAHPSFYTHLHLYDNTTRSSAYKSKLGRHSTIERSTAHNTTFNFRPTATAEREQDLIDAQIRQELLLSLHRDGYGRIRKHVIARESWEEKLRAYLGGLWTDGGLSGCSKGVVRLDMYVRDRS